MKRFLALVLALVMVLSLTACAKKEENADPNSLPREETLYFAGQQWGAVNTWNPIGANQNCWVISGGSAAREVMFETPYMYNPLDGSMKPLLADGDYTWNADLTELSFKFKDAAKWSDGTDVTGADLVRTWEIGCEIMNGTGSGYISYIDKIVADGKNVTIYAAKNDAGQPKNPLKVLDFIVSTYVAQAAWIDTVAERNNNDATAILNDPAEDVVWSGVSTTRRTGARSFTVR